MSARNNINIRELQELGREISNCLKNVKVIFMFGSCSWTTDDTISKDSDLDLEIITNGYRLDISKNTFLNKYRLDIKKGFSVAKETNSDVILYRFNYKDVEVMLHFIPQSNFEKLINLTTKNLMDGLYLFREVRNYSKKNAKYVCCGFTGESKIIKATCLEQDSGWYLMDLPLCKIENNVFYGGIFPEWHLTPPIMLAGDEYWLHQWTNKLFNGYSKRLQFEKNRNNNCLEFTNILERKYRISKCLLHSLNKKAEQNFTIRNE